ncbi:HAMP domain-containing sensor histidine kinase [Megasphaera paucivorans]|uniref:histidine kinase n=1 Tax=Megasphaera paucivorans TaxID=349095 RepID=A0A1G9ZAP7_9FIRM|nr:HAMP domain-containing sensor histidine kinase [Megasphaera paucivorans]SDN18548.1 Signal transduction histidine kinase [Megasphaera paucivorans]
MTLKRRMLISNLIMIVLPFVISSLVGLFAAAMMHDAYWNPVENMFSDRDELVYAQSLLYGEQKPLTDTDPAHAEQREAAVRRLVIQMADLGYHVQYTLNGEEQFNNITPEDDQIGIGILGEEARKLDYITASKGNVHIIKTQWVNGNDVAIIRAINPGKDMEPVHFSFFYTYVSFFLFIMFFFVLITMVIVNTIMYNKSKELILDPLQQISKAAKAIRSGDLTTPVNLKGKQTEELLQVCHDFSDMQTYLKNSMARQAEYEKYRRELLAGISHDLRTPLTSIKGYAEGLLTGIADTQEKQQRYYRAIQTRADDLERLVNNLSLYNHFDTSMFMAKPEICSFSEILQTYIIEEKERFEKDNIVVEWNMETDEDRVYLDKTEFHRIFDNLFNNSVKYRVRPVSHIRLHLEKEDNVLVFLFSDDGPGIVASNTDYIFEAFVRLDAARTHTDQGSGLGLAIVKKIIEAHKGTIRAYNDRGLTICITLPLYKG